jgi:hypothetical protein
MASLEPVLAKSTGGARGTYILIKEFNRIELANKGPKFPDRTTPAIVGRSFTACATCPRSVFIAVLFRYD